MKSQPWEPWPDPSFCYLGLGKISCVMEIAQADLEFAAYLLTTHLPASDSQVLRLQACPILPISTPSKQPIPHHFVFLDSQQKL